MKKLVFALIAVTLLCFTVMPAMACKHGGGGGPCFLSVVDSIDTNLDVLTDANPMPAEAPNQILVSTPVVATTEGTEKEVVACATCSQPGSQFDSVNYKNEGRYFVAVILHEDPGRVTI
jgi:hypothetical protein